MNKKKLLAENFLIYGLGQIVYKIIPIIIMPILVRIMPNSSYYLGINDLVNTLISLAAAVGLMGLYDAVFRLFFDYNEQETEQKKQVCSTALGMTILFSMVCFGVVFLFRKSIAQLFFKDMNFDWLVVICGINIILTNVDNILMTPTRMLNERKRFIVGKTLFTVFSYSIALLGVCQGYYIIALPLGMTLSFVLSVLYYGYYNRKWFAIKAFSITKISPLLKIGVPLFPTFLIFWIFSSFDKMMILEFLGVEANGMYSVANKLAQVSQFITAAFAAGWSYFNFATMKDEKRVDDFSKLIEYIVALGICAFLFCRIFGNPIMGFLFTAEYGDLGNVFSYLFLAPIVNMIFQLLSSQFLLLKKTIISTLIALSGVCVNVVLNYYWLQKYSVLGASMATVVSYVFIGIIAAIILKKRNMIKYNVRYVYTLGVFFTILYMELTGVNYWIIYILSVFGMLGMIILYIGELLKIIKRR